jgi:hypothetical protein
MEVPGYIVEVYYTRGDGISWGLEDFTAVISATGFNWFFKKRRVRTRNQYVISQSR